MKRKIFAILATCSMIICLIGFGSITSNASSTKESEPNNAIVYFIRMDGLTSTSAKNISVSNSKGNSVSLNQYVWQKDGLVNINMDVKDNWSAQFTYRKSTVFSPTLVLRYVYPVVE